MNNFKTAAEMLLKALRYGWSFLQVVCGFIICKILEGIGELLRILQKGTEWFIDTIGDLLHLPGEIIKMIKNYINGIINKFLQVINGAVAYFQRWVEEGARVLGEAFNSLVLTIMNVIKAGISAIIASVMAMINAINGLASLFNMISQIISQIMSVVSIITQIMMIANVIQTAIEVATCGIGALITRVILPVIATLVVNYAIPEVVRNLVGISISVSLNPNELLDVAINGIPGLIKFLMMKIIGVLGLILLFKVLGVNSNIDEINEENLMNTAFSTYTRNMLEFEEKKLGTNCLKTIIPLINNHLTESNHNEDSPKLPSNPNEFLAMSKNLENKYADIKDKIKKVLESSSIVKGIINVYMLLHMLFNMITIYMIQHFYFSMTSFDPEEFKKGYAECFIWSFIPMFISFAFECALRRYIRECLSNYDVSEGKLNLIREYIDLVNSFESIFFIVSVCADLAQEYLSLKRSTKSTRFEKASKIVSILKNIVKLLMIVIAIIDVVSSYFMIKNYEDLVLPVYFTIAFGILGVANFSLLSACILKDKKYYKQFANKKEDEEDTLGKAGKWIRLIGDVSVILSFISYVITKISRNKGCEKYALGCITIFSIIGMIGDIIHDQKISVLDVATAIYTGLSIASLLEPI